MAYLEVQNAGKMFTGSGKTYEALRGVNLQIEEGEFVALIGHSGCGKSTLLNMIAGLGLATAGRVVAAGKTVAGPGPDRMVAFQNHSLLPWFTVRQNIALAVKAVHPQLSIAEQDALVESHVQMVQLGAAADKKPNQISGGMRQRVGLARALATQPKVLLLDEPFGALDALTRGRLQEQLLKIWEAHRITVVMVTHDVDEALLLSDRIVMMSNGPAATVAEIMTVELPRPRQRLEVINNPNYYRQRNELLYYLQKAKKALTQPKTPARTTVTLGFVALSDCAPLVVAQEKGLFAKHGLAVTLSKEPSWKAILEGIREDRLDAAPMVAGMPLAEKQTALIAPMTLTRNGNAITLSRRFWEQGIRTRADLKAYLVSSGKVPTLGIVHASSMHNLMLRHWLAAGGINPDQEVKLVVIPPPQMVSNLQAQNIDGYCTGEPWNARAVHEGIGFVIATDLDIWPGHPEKVLGMKASWAEANQPTQLALIKALIEACQFCQAPENRTEVVRLITQKPYVNSDPSYTTQGICGSYDYGFGRTEATPDFNVFFQLESNRTEYLWILNALVRWGLIPPSDNWQMLLDRVYPTQVYQQACQELGLSVLPSSYQALQLPDGSHLDPTLVVV